MEKIKNFSFKPPMIDFTTKILGMKGYRCIKYKEEEEKIQVYFLPLRKTGECSICNRR